MRLFKAALLAWMIVLLLGSWQARYIRTPLPVLAQDGDEEETPPAEDTPRTTTITIPVTTYRWWLIRYSNNWIECSFVVEHEGTPTGDDIANNCTEDVYEEWLDTEPCNLAAFDSYSECPGFYLQSIEAKPGEREIVIELPEPVAWVSIANCNKLPPDERCTTLPNLLLTAEEPLPNETIISVQGTIGGEPFSCPGNTCSLPLPPTGNDGVLVEFWADSSFGDSTDLYTARVRMIPWGDFMNPEHPSEDPSRYYVDVISDRWRDGELATCSDIWEAFPSLGGLPDWLTSPETVEELQSDISYYYLAGSLITYGVVDASACLDGGLQAPNIASPCGVEAARPQLQEWQNRFDGEILEVSKDIGVPARLLKNVFARESQIWPGIYTTYREAGLGQLTDNGADTILLWNPDFFHQFCPLVLDDEFCLKGFGNLDDIEQEMLRGALVNEVNASCPGCPAGIDLSEANYSVRVFAEGMLANCEQVRRIINNLTGLSPGQTTSYEDLWRFTLVNYNAGPGCLSTAIDYATLFSDSLIPVLDWETVTSYLDPVCQGAVGYVEDITRSLKIDPTPTPWLPQDDSIPTPELPRVIFTMTPTAPPLTATPAPTLPPGATATLEEPYP
jgi:hypothetical protein